MARSTPAQKPRGWAKITFRSALSPVGTSFDILSCDIVLLPLLSVYADMRVAALQFFGGLTPLSALFLIPWPVRLPQDYPTHYPYGFVENLAMRSSYLVFNTMFILRCNIVNQSLRES